MKLVEVVGVMNIADISVASKTIRELLPERPLDMFHRDDDPTLRRYGDAEVESITNVCNLGVTIWIK